MARWLPRPSQVGHAPNGLLKEKSLGSISEMVKPETGQANFSENRMRSCVSFFDLLTDSSAVSSAGSGLVCELRDGEAIGQLQRRLQRIRQPRRDVGAHDDAVHDDVDVVLVFLVERRHVRDLVEDAIDLDPLEALLL